MKPEFSRDARLIAIAFGEHRPQQRLPWGEPLPNASDQEVFVRCPVEPGMWRFRLCALAPRASALISNEIVSFVVEELGDVGGPVADAGRLTSFEFEKLYCQHRLEFVPVWRAERRGNLLQELPLPVFDRNGVPLRIAPLVQCARPEDATPRAGKRKTWPLVGDESRLTTRRRAGKFGAVAPGPAGVALLGSPRISAWADGAKEEIRAAFHRAASDPMTSVQAAERVGTGG